MNSIFILTNTCTPISTAAVQNKSMLRIKYFFIPFRQAIKEAMTPSITNVIYGIILDARTKSFELLYLTVVALHTVRAHIFHQKFELMKLCYMEAVDCIRPLRKCF